MKRVNQRTADKTTDTGTKRLVLRRDTIKVLEEDALHQARGGAAYGSSGMVFEA
jgi:hypothetical protein